MVFKFSDRLAEEKSILENFLLISLNKVTNYKDCTVQFQNHRRLLEHFKSHRFVELVSNFKETS